jgi:hypothetical protein
MSARFGVAVLLIATAAWLVAESQSFGGHHRRRGRCGGYSACSSPCGSYSDCGGYSGCGGSSGCGGYSGCNTGCDPCGSGAVSSESAPAAPSPTGEAAPPPPPPPTPDAGAAIPSKSMPVVTSTTGPVRYYYSSARRVRWIRR